MYQSLFQENKEYYSIKFENPLLNYLGLTSATTGQLYNWWFQRNYRGEYTNQNTFLIDNPDFNYGDDPSPENPQYVVPSFAQFLSLTNPAQNESNNYTFKGWRKQGFNGKDFYYYAPLLEDGTNRYLGWSLFEGAEVGSINVFDSYCSSSSYNPLAGAKIKYKYEDLSWDNNYDINCIGSNSQVDSPDCSGLLPKWFYRLINSYTSVVEHGWGGIGGEPKNWPKCLRARKALADDMIIGGGLVWSGVLGFNVNLGSVQCLKFEPVKYTLQFFEPDDLKKKNENFAAMKKIFLSAPAQDPMGRKIANAQNGEYTSVLNEDNTSEHQVGELSVTWNPVDRKYESGTLQMPAVLMTDIGASNYRSADFLDAASIEELLNNPNSTNYINMPTGLAIPLISANGNPSTIAPSYDQEESCRTTNDKFKIIVYNPFPRTYKKDTTVMLSKINGVWIPLDPGTEAVEAKNEFLGKWEFAYFMTNAENYFTNRITNSEGKFTRIDSLAYEINFRKHLYLTSLDSELIKTKNIPGVTADDITISPNPYGYFHITSWDFMGKQMGGTRVGANGVPGNAIAGTVVGYDLDDNIVDKTNRTVNLTNPFFGCVFPDGYNPDQVREKFEKYSKNNIPIQRVGSKNYLSDITNSKEIFDDSFNRNIETVSVSTVNSGVFAGLKKGSYLLRHLPADIACNSTRCIPFSIQNGSPIKNWDYISKFLTPGKKTENELNPMDSEFVFADPNFMSYFIETKNDQDDPDEPVWNLEPVRKNKIQFRPMKAELYASAEWRILSDKTDFFRRLNLSYPFNPPEPVQCCDQFGNPITNNGQPVKGFVCDGKCSSLPAPHCSSSDPRLAILPPDIYGKIFPRSYSFWTTITRSRGKFGMRAAMMVKDFFNADLKDINSSWDKNGRCQSPLWGCGNNVEARNLPSLDNIATKSLTTDNYWWNTLETAMQYYSYNVYGTEPPSINPKLERILNGIESSFSFEPVGYGKFSNSPTSCLAFVGTCGIFYAWPCGLPTDSVPLNPFHLGLAYGQNDYVYKGRTGKLAFMDGDINSPMFTEIKHGLINPVFDNPDKVGLGAVGVIGATCSIKSANPKGITFKSDFYYGTNTKRVDGEDRAQFRDDAGSPNGILNYNTTGLYARIFHFWPRHLTIYDPRFFAVHHFNDGVGKRFDDVQKAYYIGGQYIENPTDAQKELAETENYPFNFTASISASTVDLAIPTLYDGTSVGNSTVLADAIGGTGGFNLNKKLREKQHWRIPQYSRDNGMQYLDGRNRRGRLLPYKYTKTTIRAASSNNDSVILHTPANPAKKVKELAIVQNQANIFVLNRGQNYRIGDKLTATAGVDFVLLVSQIAEEDNPTLGYKKGAILGLQISQAGEDFNASDFMKAETVLDVKAKSAARITNLSTKSGGSGFVGYLINGVVGEKESEDKKPAEIALVKLTPPNDGMKGPADGSYEITTPIPDDNRQAYDLYDIFLHFHNDASHTFGHKWDNIVGLDPYINLEIL